MKNLFFIFFVILTLGSCRDKDDDNPQNPIEQLPPLTNTGANKAGCLVNGVAFLPKGYSPNGSNVQVYYDGSNFTLSITENVNGEIKLLMLAHKNELLQENIVYQLNESSDSTLQTPFGYGFFSNSNSDFNTNSMSVGELKITYHNYNEAIISGTFWFDAVNINGEKVEVREGRFDMQY